MNSEGEPRILLIEDDRLDAELIEEMLERRFAQPFCLAQFRYLVDGLGWLDKSEVDVILVDLSLPDSSGLDTFLKIHDVTDAPIIVISGATSPEDMARTLLREGADDYLGKEELTADSLARSIHFSLQRGKHREMERELERAQEQLHLLERIQQHLIPRFEMSVPGYDIAGTVFPAEMASGDYCDFFPMRDGTLGFVVADVSGHGFAASQLMLQTRVAIRALASLDLAADAIVTRLNRLLLNDCHATGLFLTLFLGCLKPEERTLEFAAAGHCGYLLEPSGKNRRLTSTGPAIGLVDSRDIPSRTVSCLGPGAILLLPTDGIAEAASPSNELFGAERMTRVVRDLRTRSARQIVETLHEQALRFSCSQEQADDMTAVVIKVLEAD